MKEKMNKKIISLIKVIGIVLYIYLLSKQNWPILISIILKVNIMLVLSSIIIFFFIIYYFKVLRIRVLLNLTDRKITKIFKLYLASIFWGAVTPGRLGEFIRVIYLVPLLNSKSKALLVTLIDRLYDVLFLCLLSIIGIFCILNIEFINKWTSVFFIFFVIIIFYYRNKILMFIINKIKIIRDINVNEEYIKELLSLKNFFYSTIYTFFSWMAYFGLIYIISKSIHITINIIDLSLITSMASIVALIPITISGIGTRDATFIYLLSRYNIYQEQAFALCLMFILIIIMPPILTYPFVLKIKLVSNKSK